MSKRPKRPLSVIHKLIYIAYSLVVIGVPLGVVYQSTYDPIALRIASVVAFIELPLMLLVTFGVNLLGNPIRSSDFRNNAIGLGIMSFCLGGVLCSFIFISRIYTIHGTLMKVSCESEHDGRFIVKSTDDPLHNVLNTGLVSASTKQQVYLLLQNPDPRLAVYEDKKVAIHGVPASDPAAIRNRPHLCGLDVYSFSNSTFEEPTEN